MPERQLKPLRVFRDIAEFADRHKAGTEAEFEADQKLVDAINKEENKFRAWVLSKTRQTTKRLEYLIVVQPGPDGERKIPQPGEPAKLRIVFDDDSVTRYWESRRIETPLALLSAVQCPEKLATYQVTVHIAEAHDNVQPLFDAPAEATAKVPARDTMSTNNFSGNVSSAGSDSAIADCLDRCCTTLESTDGASEMALTRDNAVRVNFLLSASEATKNAELGALEQLCGRYVNASERQLKAFEYFVLLRDPEFVVDLHEEIPHLKTAMQHPSWPGSALAKKFEALNPQQKDAYLHGFRKLMCGICILPGGPGAGKTHFNLFTIAMAQSQQLPRPVMVKGKPERRCAKVLFIIDMNLPANDVCNRMMRLYKDLGMKKSVIRMRSWGSEVRSSDRLNAAEDAASGEAEAMDVDFTNQFLRTANLRALGQKSTESSCEAPSLDDAAWANFDALKGTKYEELAQYLEGELWEESEIVPFRFRRLVYNLYRDTLSAADFIATTPVAASNHFKGMFKPDLVFFDESPHARELTNLVAIANFDPIAWVFCGDHRQTVPYVGSTASDGENPHKRQMQVSMMERAAFANAIQYELLMNHRAFGGLHQLASTVWYGGRMVSGNGDRQPASLRHMRQYLERFLGGRKCDVPRLLVHLNNCGPAGRDGTSAWNPTHTAWVMTRVWELLADENFKSERDEPGTILIISPYKKAFWEYRKEVKKLPEWAQRRVETRTVDVVQGHEADFVFLDLVKAKSTKFLDDPNRLCVALTRARIGEMVLMHPDMVTSTTFIRNSRNLRPIYNICKEAGQVVHVDPYVAPAISTDSVPIPPANDSSAASDTWTYPDSSASESLPSVFVQCAPQDVDESSEVSEPSNNSTTPNEDQTTAAQPPIEGVTTTSASDVPEMTVTCETHDIKTTIAPCAIDSKHAQQIAEMDDGDSWWDKMMSGRAAKKTPGSDQKASADRATSMLVTTSEEKVSETTETETSNVVQEKVVDVAVDKVLGNIVNKMSVDTKKKDVIKTENKLFADTERKVSAIANNSVKVGTQVNTMAGTQTEVIEIVDVDNGRGTQREEEDIEIVDDEDGLDTEGPAVSATSAEPAVGATLAMLSAMVAQWATARG